MVTGQVTYRVVQVAQDGTETTQVVAAAANQFPAGTQVRYYSWYTGTVLQVQVAQDGTETTQVVAAAANQFPAGTQVRYNRSGDLQCGLGGTQVH